MSKKISVHSELPELKKSDIESIEVMEIDSIDKDIDPKSHYLDGDRRGNVFQRFGTWFWRKKWFTIPGLVIIIFAVLLAIPVTGYAMTGWFWKESIVVIAKDAANNEPISEATVTVDGVTAKTDGKGRAAISSVTVGPHQLSIKKTYYQTTSSTITVPWFAHGKEFAVAVTATGRSVPLVVTDRVTGNPIEGVLVSVTTDNKARTDVNGKATIIIPADKSEMPTTLSAEKYLSLSSKLQQNGTNQFQLIPSGKMYFLSKLSGRIDVVKTNLDGSDRQVVYAGTGAENDNTTSLLASTDWKYLMLKSKREVGKSEVLTMISTTDDSTSRLDDGNVEISLVGWSGHQFIYQVDRQDIGYGQAKRQALITVAAETKKATTIDETLGDGGNTFQQFSSPYIVDGLLLYAKKWSSGGAGGSNQDVIVSVRPDGISKKTLKSFQTATTYAITGKIYLPQEEYFAVYTSSGTTQYFEYSKGLLKTSADKSDAFDVSKQYPAYLLSPDGDKTFWAEARDGKNALFIGDSNAENGQMLQLQSDFKAYGWLTENYVLVQKGDSELYITTPDQLKAGIAPLKISDYHKPLNSPVGYGSGYGGQ